MFEFFFKYPPSVFTRGTFLLLSTWPRFLLYVAIAAGIALLAGALWRSRSAAPKGSRPWRLGLVWLLQSLFLTLLLFLLWQPAISIASLKPQQNIIAVMVDDSRSMAQKDGAQTRHDQAIGMLGNGILSRLRSRFQVRLYQLGADLKQVGDLSSLTAQQNATHIDEALKQIASESGSLPIGSVVLISDGGDTSGGITSQTIAALQNRHLPVNTIAAGSGRALRDVEIDSLEFPAEASINSLLQAQVAIRQHGFSGQRVQVLLTSAREVLATREIELSSAGNQIETIDFKAGNTGVKDLRARIVPLPGEENLANNEVTRVLSVNDTKHRILYIEGEPRWDYKFLRRAVEDDPALHITSVLRTTQNKLYRQGVGNPQELESGFPPVDELFGYDGLILGSVEAAYFSSTQKELIKQFVDRRGAGLLFLGGRASLADGGYNVPPFLQLLPVALPGRKNTFHRDLAQADLTAAGEQNLICRIDDTPQKSLAHWKELPYLASYQEIGAPKPGAVTLAQAHAGNRRSPLLVIENFGRGRTAVLASGGVWRWQMQQPVEDMSEETFWRQLLRWLATTTPGRVVVTTSTPLLEDDGHIHFSAEVRNPTYLPESDAQAEARIILADGSTQLVPMTSDSAAPGLFSADWEAPRAGSYVAEVTARRGAEQLGRGVLPFRREDGVAENFHTDQNADLLRKVSAETGGHFYEAGNVSRLPSEVAYSEAGVSAREIKQLWNMPVVFLLLIALRAAEWILRRRWGAV